MKSLAHVVLLLALSIPTAPVLAQTACAIQNKATLLWEFSDNVAPGTITPQNVRNVICSSQLLQSAGGTAAGQAIFTSPSIIFVTSYGALTASNGQLELSRDGGTTWFIFSLVGGSVPVMANDQVRVTWFGASAPAVTFFPNGNS